MMKENQGTKAATFKCNFTAIEYKDVNVYVFV